MSVSFEINASTRKTTGTGHARRMRNSGQVPGVLYGAGKDPTAIVLGHDDVVQHLAHEAFYSHILTLNLDSKPEKVVLKDVQRHPAKARVDHMEFQRVSDTTRIRMHVPFHFAGEAVAPGVKLGGGIFTHLMNHADVICMAKDLPEFIEVDVSQMEAGDSIHLSEVKLPAGVRFASLQQGADHDLPIVSIHIPRAAVEETAEAAAAAAAAQPAAATTPSA